VKESDLSERLADAFERVGFIDAKRRGQIEALMAERDISFEMALYQVEPPSRERLKTVLEEVTGTTCLDPSIMNLSDQFVAQVKQLIDPRVLVMTRAFPVQIESNRLHVALVNPTNEDVLDRLEGLSGMKVTPHVAPERGIADVLEMHCADAIRAMRSADEDDYVSVCDAVFEEMQAADMKEYADPAIRLFARLGEAIAQDEEAGIKRAVRELECVQLLHQILNRMVWAGASDIHFEPQEEGLRVRARIDGVLRTQWQWPRLAVVPVVARIKAMSNLDPLPAEQPLDSNIEYGVIYGREVEFRVSTLPSLFGEKAVLRILDRSKGRVELSDLGFEPETFAVAQRNLESPHGLILVTGPTGSGKTTTLYAALDILNQEGVNIVTAEDPVESKIEGTTQVLCGEGKVTFADALRSFLRQDPDIVMVGEIRDQDTAVIGLRAALTGHLVLSTLHTNDAPSTIMRLTNMGLEPFMVGAALRMVVAQRLVRRLCKECREEVEVDSATAKLMEDAGITVPDKIFEAVGCPACNHSGYKGRTGLYEVLEVDDAIEQLIADGESPGVIRKAAREAGCNSLFDDGLLKVSDGRTSLAEVYRVTAEAE
jgi:type IV pilus assembly protein PilB